MEELEERLAAADIVLASTGAREPVLTRAMVQRAVRRRRGRPLFVIDIAVPRDVDPDVHALDGVFLYNIDDLRAVVEANAAERRLHVPHAEAVVARQAREFGRWLRQRLADPVIRALRAKFKAVADREIERLLRRLPQLDEKQREQVRAVSDAIVGKLLHDATVALKRSAEQGRHEQVFQVVAEMFSLEAGEPPEESGLREPKGAPEAVRLRPLRPGEGAAW